jgi:hypothetical protein
MKAGIVFVIILIGGTLSGCLGKTGKTTRQVNQRLADYNFTEMMQPIPLTSKLEHPDYFTWGASVLRGEDEKFHMVYCRWPKKYPFGDGWLIDAELCYAVADHPEGPFKHIKTVVAGRKSEGLFHAWDGASVYNPHLKKFGDRFYLYYTGNYDPFSNGFSKDRAVLVRNQCIGVIEFDSWKDLISGHFRRSEKPLLQPLSRFGFNVPPSEEFGDPDKLTPANIVVVNPSVEKRTDGKFIMVFKGWRNQKGFGPVHGVAIADSPVGPFSVQPDPIFEIQLGNNKLAMAEDPFIWYDKKRMLFYAMVKDFHGEMTKAGPSLALFNSADGIKWQPADKLLASDLTIQWENGVKHKVAFLERPQLLFDEEGEPLVLFAACAIDSPFKEGGHSFNVHIPLTIMDE